VFCGLRVFSRNVFSNRRKSRRFTCPFFTVVMHCHPQYSFCCSAVFCGFHVKGRRIFRVSTFVQLLAVVLLSLLAFVGAARSCFRSRFGLIQVQRPGRAVRVSAFRPLRHVARRCMVKRLDPRPKYLERMRRSNESVLPPPLPARDSSPKCTFLLDGPTPWPC